MKRGRSIRHYHKHLTTICPRGGSEEDERGPTLNDASIPKQSRGARGRLINATPPVGRVFPTLLCPTTSVAVVCNAIPLCCARSSQIQRITFQVIERRSALRGDRKRKQVKDKWGQAGGRRYGQSLVRLGRPRICSVSRPLLARASLRGIFINFVELSSGAVLRCSERYSGHISL